MIKALAGLLLIASSTSFLNTRNTNINIAYNGEDTIVKKFQRHGLLYLDKKVNGKIITRFVYADTELLYRYPVTRENIRPSMIHLLSGNRFLKKGVPDTINFYNCDLPMMNRTVWAPGSTLTRISDSSWIIYSNEPVGSITRFYIGASDNYEEMQKGEGFISDSLLIPIR